MAMIVMQCEYPHVGNFMNNFGSEFEKYRKHKGIDFKLIPFSVMDIKYTYLNKHLVVSSCILMHF